MPLEFRSALPQDAASMAELINRIISIGGTTAFREMFNNEMILSEFVQPEHGISCHVAVDGFNVLGFQALLWCDPDWPGEDKLPDDWAVIATYVDPAMHGQGVGRGLFKRTVESATVAGVSFIDATIRKENTGGLAYYERMGFADYRSSENSVSKRFAIR